MLRIKQVFVQKFSFFLAMILAIWLMLPFAAQITAQASLPKGNISTGRGKVYDGIDIEALIGSGIYFGAYKHTTATKSTRSGFGTQSSAYETFDTPILWRVMGEDRVSAGSSSGDEHLALMSEYTVDFKRISGYGNEYIYYGYSFFVGEGDYGVSYTDAWLNTEGTYTYSPNNKSITNNPSRYGYVPLAPEPGFLESFKIGSSYSTELDAMGRSDAYTYFIGNGTDGVAVAQVVTNPSSILKNLGSEWSNYFSSGVPSNTSWPYIRSNAYAYIPFGVAATDTIYWNADGEPSSAHTISSSVNNASNAATLKNGSSSEEYWLRNPGSTDTSTRNTFVSGKYVVPVHNVFSRDVLGVRPVIKIDPEQILMIYEIVSTKSQADHIATDIGDSATTTWNYDSGTDKNYKLTLISNNVSINSATLPDGCNDIDDAWALLAGGNSITLTSIKGSDYTGDYLAYKIVEELSDGSRQIVAYGDNKGAADLDQLIISDLRTAQSSQQALGTGDFSLYVWAQKEDSSGESGTSVHSFEGSTPITAFAAGAPLPPASVTLDYDQNSGSDPVSNLPSVQNTTAGTTINISGNTPARTGYTFKGWNTQADSSGTSYAANDPIIINVDTVLYAQWEPVTSSDVTLTYDKNSGTDPVSNLPVSQSVTAGTTVNVSGNTPARLGYTFKGWNTQADGSGTSYAANSSLVLNADMTLYAQWESITPTNPGGNNDTGNGGNNGGNGDNNTGNGGNNDGSGNNNTGNGNNGGNGNNNTGNGNNDGSGNNNTGNGGNNGGSGNNNISNGNNGGSGGVIFFPPGIVPPSIIGDNNPVSDSGIADNSTLINILDPTDKIIKDDISAVDDSTSDFASDSVIEEIRSIDDDIMSVDDTSDFINDGTIDDISNTISKSHTQSDANISTPPVPVTGDKQAGIVIILVIGAMLFAGVFLTLMKRKGV